jgi:hypothetical protein
VGRVFAGVTLVGRETGAGRFDTGRRAALAREGDRDPEDARMAALLKADESSGNEEEPGAGEPARAAPDSARHPFGH